MNTGANVKIRRGTIAECIAVSQQIPEFSGGIYDEKVYETRLFNNKSLILVALDADTPVGFKVGYQRDNDGSFFIRGSVVCCLVIANYILHNNWLMYRKNGQPKRASMPLC